MDRRHFLQLMLAACAAPAVIPAAHASRLMRIKPVLTPTAQEIVDFNPEWWSYPLGPGHAYGVEPSDRLILTREWKEWYCLAPGENGKFLIPASVELGTYQAVLRVTYEGAD